MSGLNIEMIKDALTLAEQALLSISDLEIQNDDWCPFCKDHDGSGKHRVLCPRKLALDAIKNVKE